MRVMLIGQKWLGEQALAMCLSKGHEVVAASAPGMDDRLARAADAAGVPVAVARRIEAGHVPPGTDLLLCAHAHAYVSSEARSAARLGALGYHPSLLPRHRGRDAIRWALHMREAVTGGTVYWLEDGADTGPIAAQEWCWVHPTDTPETLWRRELAPLGLRLLGRVLDALEQGHRPATPQEESLATWEPAFTPSRLAG